MKPLRTFLLAVILLSSGLELWGQKTNEIVCDLRVEILPYYPIQDSTIFSFYGNVCKITQSFQIRNYQKDTAYFILDKPSQFSFLDMLYFQKMTVKEKNTRKTIPHIFTSDTLKFILPKKDCIIEIHYYCQPDYFMFGNDYMGCVFCPYQQSWFSWYFSVPDMKINNMIVNVPEHLYFFSNLMQKKVEKGKIYLSTDSIPNGISFFWVEKRYYEQIKTNIQTNQYNLYLFKDFILTEDTTSCYTLMLPSQRVGKNMISTHISELNRAVQGIEKIFQKKVNFDIVEACLDISQGEDKVRWGSAFSLSENQVFIFMDTSFWTEHECLHEMVHAYNDILPSKNDSSYYFFHESMTEYLAIYFKYNLRKNRETVYEEKLLKYINLKQDYTSIFEINKSELGLDFGGTFGITYLKTPFVINSFAKKIGEDKFIEILSHFYKQIRETRVVNFQEFEKIFKSNGVSDNDWDWFMKNL